MKLLNPISMFVIKRPKTALATIATITAILLLISAIVPYDSDFSESDWIPKHDVVTKFEEIGEKFQEDDSAHTVNIIVHAKDTSADANLLTVKGMIDILKLEREIANNPEVKDYLSGPSDPSSNFVGIPNILAPLLNRGHLSIDDLLVIYESMTDEQFDLLMTQAVRVPKLNQSFNFLLSKDFQKTMFTAEATILIVRLNGSEELIGGGVKISKEIEDAERSIDYIAESFESNTIDSFVISQTKVNDGFEAAEQNMSGQLLPLAFILIIIILFITFRSFSDLVFSLVPLVITLIWVNSTIVILGFKNSPLIQAVPIFLIGLGVDYGIHLSMRYREELVKKSKINRSISITIMSVGAALLLAAMTDIVGFLSNTSSSILVIKEFGIIVSLGILYSFFIFILFVPASRILLDRFRENRKSPLLSAKNKTRAQKTNEDISGLSAKFANFMDNGAKMALKIPKVVMISVVAISFIMLILGTQLSSGFSGKDFLSEGSQLKEEYIFMEESFAFSQTEAVVYLRGEDVADYEVLKGVYEVQENMKNDRHTVIKQESPTSPLTVMQDYANSSDALLGGNYNAEFAHIWMNSDPDENNIPQSNITGLMDWLWVNHPEALSNTLYKDPESGKYTTMLVRVIANSKMAAVADEVHDDLKEDVMPLENLKNEGRLDEVVITGNPAIEDIILKTINESMIMSLTITLVISLITVTIVFYMAARSLVLGLITMIPVVLVLLWILGTMFILGIPLNVVTVIIAAVSIGLGINYAIHISHRFVEELNGHNRISKAVHQTVKSTGVALFGGAVTTFVGFGIMSFSVQIPFQQFGIMMALSIMFSFLASVFVLPSMLVIWARVTSESRAINRTGQKEVKENEGRIAHLVTINFQNPCIHLRKHNKNQKK